MTSIIGYDAQAYTQRSKGHSPTAIYDAAWAIADPTLQGVVLDAGSGEGEWIQRLKKNTSIQKIISVDLVDDGASQIDGVEFHLTDLATIPLPISDHVLDWIFAIEVLEHLANPRHFIKEAARCLKPQGKMLITTPANESLRAKLSFLVRGYFPAFCDHDYSCSGHITPITELDLKRMSQEANFQSLNFFYPLPGLVPGTSLSWQCLFPGLKGKLWSDCMIALLRR